MCIEDKFSVISTYPFLILCSTEREQIYRYVSFYIGELILSKQFRSNVLISLTGFLRVSTNLPRIESSSRNFSQHAGYVTVSIRMHRNACYIRGVFRREAVAAKNQLR